MSINRRTFLRTASVAAATVALSACGATPTPTPLPTATKVPPTAVPPTAVPVVPTATKPPTVATAVPPTAVPPTAVPPTATPLPAKDTTSPKWLLPGSGGISMPIVKDKMTFTQWTNLNPNPGATLKSYGEMTCFKELEKRSNIHIEFQHPPMGGAQEKEAFNLMMASRKFPDIIEYDWTGVGGNTYEGGGAKAIKDGVILRLNSLIDQYAPNLKNCFTKNPEWRKQVVNDDGDIYGFPFLRGDPWLLVFVGPIIREDFLKKLNIPIPTTVDEWHDMLVAFKTKDPNGNGKADEIPFTPAWGTGDAARFAWASGFAFIGAWGIGMEFFNDGGKVKWGPVEPAFKEFLKVMVQWYKEGLIDPDWVSMDVKLRDAKITGNQLCSLVGYTGSGIGTYAGLMKGKEPASFKLVGAPYPTLKKGEKPLFGQIDNVAPGLSTAITTACKNVKEAVQWLDYAYSYDGHILFNFGAEGISYNWVNGYPKYTDAVVKHATLPLSQSMGQHFRSNFGGPFVQDRRYFEQYLALPEQLKAVEVWSEPMHDKIMPPITPTQEESKRFAKVMTEIKTFFAEQFAKTLTGQIPVSDWDKTVAQFKQLGVDDAIAVHQAALDRYLKR